MAILGLLSSAGAAATASAVEIVKIAPSRKGENVSPEKARKLDGLRRVRYFGKGWPYKGKNRAQREALRGAFVYLA